MSLNTGNSESTITNEVESLYMQNFDIKGKDSKKDLKNFFNYDENMPMKFRIYLFRQ